MMLVHGPIVVILSLLLGLLSTTANAAPLDGSIALALASAKSREQQSSPHTNGINRNAPQYRVWFCPFRPVFTAPEPIKDQLFDEISRLEHLNGGDIEISLLESCPESAREFWYQKVGDNQVHYAALRART
ncbi:hypothetical protein GGU10DRAFT_434014 [Lentinula aff. detonsa]|uniref:Uncharacterized protein n=1 Tax=Lentinula aff. detonsa TaxID=2804958 RepID=A0AA38KF55_9AGAR|nr:hypothetical protein GGU10DRAFT_434014 [Lentinula aff. detonsa]